MNFFIIILLLFSRSAANIRNIFSKTFHNIFLKTQVKGAFTINKSVCKQKGKDKTEMWPRQDR